MSRLAAIAVAVSTGIVIIAVAILPFLTPAWIAFEQDRSQAAAWTGYSSADLRTATDAILADLVIGPPDFDVEVAGAPVLLERERAHMRDVRTVFAGFALVAVAAIVVLGVAAWRWHDAARRWRAVRTGAMGLAVAVVALGIVALTAFDTLFAAFHQVLFPAGSYDFDPGTDRMVQLFPFQFWQETAIAVGVVILVIAAVVAVVADRRARRAAPVAARDGRPVTVSG